MTNDFDDLASAYIDGQLTEIEAARVEGDPELLAQVAELRSITEALDSDVSPVDETLKRRQLGAALAAFEQLDIGTPESKTDAGNEADLGAGSGVADLAQHRASSERAETTTGPGRGRAGLPNWLGVAAALLLVVGGIGFVSQVTGGGDNDSSSALEAADTAEEVLAERSSGESADFDEAEDDEEAMEESDAASSAMADEAEGTETAEEDSAAADQAAGDGADDASDEAAPATTTPVEQSPSTTSTAGGLFPPESVEEARVFFGEIPDDEAIAALAEGELLAPSLSQCARNGELDDGRLVTGFVPVAVNEVNGELLFIEVEPVPLAVILTETCTPFE